MCGACSVLVNGHSVRACLLFAVQVDGQEVTTVEGLGQHETTARLRAAFSRYHALQCGFCTPGILVTATELLDDPHTPKSLTERSVREVLSGNLCRCTGYQGIVHAVLETGANQHDITTTPDPANTPTSRDS